MTDTDTISESSVMDYSNTMLSKLMESLINPDIPPLQKAKNPVLCSMFKTRIFKEHPTAMVYQPSRLTNLSEMVNFTGNIPCNLTFSSMMYEFGEEEFQRLTSLEIWDGLNMEDTVKAFQSYWQSMIVICSKEIERGTH